MQMPVQRGACVRAAMGRSAAGYGAILSVVVRV